MAHHSTNWKSQPQHNHKPKEELPVKKSHRVHPDTDALCRPATIFSQQPNGFGELGEGLPTFFSPMVQPQCNLRHIDKVVTA